MAMTRNAIIAYGGCTADHYLIYANKEMHFDLDFVSYINSLYRMLRSLRLLYIRDVFFSDLKSRVYLFLQRKSPKSKCKEPETAFCINIIHVF